MTCGSVWQGQFGVVAVATIQACHVADLLHELGIAGLEQGVELLLALFAIAAGQPDLDQFVMIQGADQFGFKIVGDALVSKQYQGFEAMTKAAEITPLVRRERPRSGAATVARATLLALACRVRLGVASGLAGVFVAGPVPAGWAGGAA